MTTPAARSAPGPVVALSQRALHAGGQPISELMHQALAHPELISLAAGFVDQQSLPVEPTRAALEHLLSRRASAQAALQYGTTAGYAPLRAMLLARLREADGHPRALEEASVDQVVVTAGSNALLHLLIDTLCDPGDIVLCAAPSYFVFLGMLSNLGIRSLGVAADADGMIPEALHDALAALQRRGELPRVKAVYVTSYFDNPSSVTLADGRRGQIVELARRWSKHQRIYVLEDTAYRELRYEGDDVPSLRRWDDEGDTVVHTGTFSKSYSPGIRVGWGILPRALVAAVLDQKGNVDFGSPNFAQHLMAAVLELGLLDPHIERLRAGYRAKLQAMLEAADEFLGGLPGVHWLRPRGGLYVWLTLPEEIDAGPAGTLYHEAMREGVLYVPGQYCFAREGIAPQHNTIRLSFGVQSPQRIRQGIQCLGRAIGRLLSR